MKKTFIFIVLTFFIASCSNIGDIRLQSTQDSIALAYISITGMAHAIKSASDNGLIEDLLKDEMKKELQDAKNLVDTSSEILYFDEAKSETALAKAEAILISLQRILEENQ